MSVVKPEQPTAAELHPHWVHAYAATFIARPDVYAVQRADGRYVSVKRPLQLELVAAHLRGAVTLGAYALDTQSRATWLCLDADTPEHWDGLLTLARSLKREEVTPYLEQSRRGGHLWLFFAPMPGTDARRFGQALLEAHHLAGVELFPKQDKLTTGPGSLVRLPLGYHRLTGRRYHFITPDGGPLAPTIREQVRLLAAPAQVPPDYIRHLILTTSEPQPPTPAVPLADPAGATLSERLKNAVSVYDFISQYVDLDERGMGHCPFHDDQHKSFGVNRTENYWHCFAGCGGGSIIDFWMKWREVHGQDPGFVATITELAAMLL